jgi:putative glycosyltransferase (TIGR04372 family)
VKRVSIQTPAVEAYGNCAEELHWGLIRAQRLKKKVAFLFVQDFVSPFVFSKRGLGINRALKAVTSPYRFASEKNPTIILSEIALTIFCYIRIAIVLVAGRLKKRNILDLTKLTKIILGDIRHHAPTVGRSRLWTNLQANSQDLDTQIGYWVNCLSQPLSVGLPRSITKKCEQSAQSLGIGQGEDYVCLHIRETGFYGSDEGMGKTSRNGSIDNYFQAIRLLNQEGFKVVRLGDKSMTRFPPLDGLIDYPFLPEKSQEMDVWLIMSCAFFIGHNSGPLDVANLFQKPTITPNIIEFNFAYPLRKGDLGILKHVYSHEEQRFLSVKEAIELYLCHDTAVITNKNYSFHENSSEEITELIQEFVESFKIGYDNNSSEYQKKVLDHRRNLESPFINSWDRSITEKERMVTRLLGCSGLLGRKFLDQNYSFNSRNQ